MPARKVLLLLAIAFGRALWRNNRWLIILLGIAATPNPIRMDCAHGHRFQAIIVSLAPLAFALGSLRALLLGRCSAASSQDGNQQRYRYATGKSA